MRILHLGKFFPPNPGGMENFLGDLLPAQRDLGLEVAALVHHQGPGWRGQWPAPAVTRDATPSRATTYPQAAPSAPPSRIYRAPCLGRLLYAPVSPSFPLWLDQAIRDFAPDLLHLHLPNTSAFAALALPRARRLPWVVHWHADVVASAIDRRLALAYHLYRPFEQRLLASARAIIATSPPYLAASRALAPWRERCVTIPLGLDPGRPPAPDGPALTAAMARWGTGEGPRVLAVGRLTYYKGHEVLIRAAAALPGSRVLIVGAGELWRRLERLIADLDLEGRIILAGHVPADELAGLLSSCDLLCLPSLERTEAFGLVLLEAMRFAKPVVVSDIPGSGTPWVVRRAGNGRLSAPGDAPALAQVLAELGAEPAERRRLGVAGARALAAEFGIQPVAIAIHRLYSKLLGGQTTSPRVTPSPS